MEIASALPSPSIPRKGDIVELEIEDWGDRGRGIARYGRMVVLTDRGLPGDKLLARITKRRSHHLEAEMQSIVAASSHRIEPRCSHFGLCGGCRLQDLEYTRQLDDKVRHVSEQLRRIGGLRELPEIEVIPADPIYGYRNKMEFSFGGYRGGPVKLGLHAQNNYGDSFDLSECWITDPRAAEIVSAARNFFRAQDQAPYDPVKHTGFLRFLVVRFGVHTGDVLVNLVTADQPWEESGNFGVALRHRCPYVTTALWTTNSSRANVATGEIRKVYFGDGVLHERLGPFTFEIAPMGFFQTNTLGAERLFSKIINWLGDGPRQILDLYAGAGAISLFLSQVASEVIGVEMHAESVSAAERNAANNGVTNCRFSCRDALEYLRETASSEIRAQTVVLDPPRAGLHPKVIKLLAQSRPSQIVYVSCNTAALARDLQLFGDAYRLVQLGAVDMFPQTPHVEAIALLEASEVSI